VPAGNVNNGTAPAETNLPRPENMLFIRLIVPPVPVGLFSGNASLAYRPAPRNRFSSVAIIDSLVQCALICFAGGLITRALKVRAMEIVEKLKPHRRGASCGIIGYIGFDGTMGTNIVFRTFAYSKGQLSFLAGSGIVADLSLHGEYQESFDKAAAMQRLLERNQRLNHVGG
jgi:hypothetical protein